jgi:hypothetical protein
MHLGPQMCKQSPFLALFTEFANCYSSITKGTKKFREECDLLPSLISWPPLSFSSNLPPLRRPEVLPILTLTPPSNPPPGPLLILLLSPCYSLMISCRLPAQVKLARCRGTHKAKQDSKKWSQQTRSPSSGPFFPFPLPCPHGLT